MILCLWTDCIRIDGVGFDAALLWFLFCSIEKWGNAIAKHSNSLLFFPGFRKRTHILECFQRFKYYQYYPLVGVNGNPLTGDLSQSKQRHDGILHTFLSRRRNVTKRSVESTSRWYLALIFAAKSANGFATCTRDFSNFLPWALGVKRLYRQTHRVKHNA
jgi:hypothetical protein